MARADTASASLRSDFIRGWQNRLQTRVSAVVERRTTLSRAVPVLIIAFLITICVGAVVQMLEQRRQVMVDARQVMEALADELAIALDHPGRDGRANPGRTFAALECALPVWATAQGRSIIVGDANGTIVASVAERSAKARPADSRRARTVAATDHVRRRRRHAGDHAAGWRRRLRHGAGVKESAGHRRRGRDDEQRTEQLAIVSTGYGDDPGKASPPF